MKQSAIVLIFAVSFMFACTYSASDNQEAGDVANTQTKLINEVEKQPKILSKNAYLIGDSIQITDLRNFKYFGAFFKGRAQYYHNYQDTIFHGKSIKGNDLLLCFFDNQIARLRYKVDADITRDLMLKHGSFKIKPLDSLARVLIKSGDILNKTESSISLNQRLKNYELTWEKPDKQIVFRCIENIESGRSFVYEERIPDYKESMVYLTRY